jgi:hypothetical protein
MAAVKPPLQPSGQAGIDSGLKRYQETQAALLSGPKNAVRLQTNPGTTIVEGFRVMALVGRCHTSSGKPRPRTWQATSAIVIGSHPLTERLHRPLQLAASHRPARSGSHVTSATHPGSPLPAPQAREQLELQALVQLKAQTVQAQAQAQTQQQARQLWGASDSELVAKLRDPAPRVRWVVVSLIGQKRIHAEKELIKRLADPDAAVREASRQALVRLARGTDFGPEPLASQADIQRAVRNWNAWLQAQDPVTGTARPTPASEPPQP